MCGGVNCEWMRTFIQHGIAKSSKYGQQQHHMLCKLDCEKFCHLIYVRKNICDLEKSVSYPVIPNVHLSVGWK